MKILIVDDIEENRDLLKVMMSVKGHTTSLAANGALALEILRTDRFDLIISDILMPVMDGFQLCSVVKTDVNLHTIPFIIYTATYTSSEDEALALKMGADRFVEKPCQPETFLRIVDEVMKNTVHSDKAFASMDFHKEENLKIYNQRLINKLEQKMIQLEHELMARQLAETALRESEAKFRSLFENHTAVKMIVDPESGDIVDANKSAALFYGWSCDELRNMNIAQINTLSPAELKQVFENIQNQITNHLEFKHRLASGKIVEVEVFSSRVMINDRIYLHSIIHDITEKRQLEKQLLQAQKLESVGRLAGGVAHDFNNMLAVILGYAELALKKVPESDKLHADLVEIYQAAERSAEITRQLLTFARQQPVKPKIIDLNETVSGTMKMLQRLIGEDIKLSWIPEANLGQTMADPSQIGQILANLCVNARDAITGTGRITIETQRVTVDEAYCAGHATFVPGDYVMLAVSDTGCGIDGKLLDQIFEPFFTTKDLGHGTGLGLATVYGIVKQSNGMINVYSEPGNGTTFKIYLPFHQGGTVENAVKHGEELPTGNGQTILVVEDDVSLLKLIRRNLEDFGYHVLFADTPLQGISLARGNRVHALLTDVVMPEMNGRDLASRLQSSIPDLRILFMSGYTANFIAQRGVLDSGVNFIQKPFSRRELACKLHDTLNGRTA